jgi:hypothetical protein
MGFHNSRSLESLNQHLTKESAMALIQFYNPSRNALEKHAGPFDVGPDLERIHRVFRGKPRWKRAGLLR